MVNQFNITGHTNCREPRARRNEMLNLPND